MASVIQLIDDIDGSPAEKTVSFSMDGVSYEIDLSADNVKTLKSEIGVYTAAARVVTRSGTKRSRGAGSSSHSRAERTAIREWGAANGFEKKERGRIPQGLMDAYRSAHSAN